MQLKRQDAGHLSGRVELWLGRLAAALGVLVGVSWVAIAAAHVDDSYNINHVAGAWMALARALDHGTLYPPPYAHGFYGGTRFMPVQIGLDALAAKLSGEYLVSGKVLEYVIAAGLLAVVYAILRRLGCTRAVGVGLTAVLLVSPTGLLAATTIRGDALPVLVQLAAIGLVAWRPAPGRLAAAAVLCVLAFLTKTTALWAPSAIALWLVWPLRRTRAAVAFAAGFAALAGVLLFVLQLASGGRMFENVFGLAFAGSGDADALVRVAPQDVVTFLQTDAAPVWALLGFAAVAVVLSLVRRAPTPFDFALPIALVILWVVSADVGTGSNQLVDVAALTVVVTGSLVSAAADRESVLRAAVLAVLVWTVASTYIVSMTTDTRRAVGDLLRGRTDAAYAVEPTRGLIPEGVAVLSEDPYVPLSRGQKPVLLDAFMLLRIARDHPEWARALERRLDRREFAAVVLIRRYEPGDSWWSEHHFGPELAAAIARNYRPDERVPWWRELWIYRPRRR